MNDLDMTEKTLLVLAVIMGVSVVLLAFIITARTLDIQEAHIKKQTTEVIRDETIRTKERHDMLQRLPF